ncbi:MAG: 3-isopropylmalate dehydratase small subunit [Acidobacteriota bacterium]
MEPLRRVTSRTVVLPIDNIDTDQIIPARFLRVTTRDGLGDHLFADWRYDTQGNPSREFPLNRPEARGAQVLVSGENFGCGSSREHAAWALIGYGIRAVVSTSIADIFRANALKNGLVPVTVDERTHRLLLDNPGVEVSVDVEAQTLGLPGGIGARFPIDAFARYCLVHGVDELDFLMQNEAAIAAYEKGSGSPSPCRGSKPPA